MHNEAKPAVVERFIRILKSEVYKYMASVSKNVYIVKFDVIVNKYNKKYHSTIKMKPVNVESNTYIVFNEENNKEEPKFEVGDHVKI